ncbi:MAG: hypothetical protein ACYC27_05055 [Armatimonadota bacterium]
MDRMTHRAKCRLLVIGFLTLGLALVLNPIWYSTPVLAGIVDVSGIEVPPVSDPVCAYCNGAGCDQCKWDSIIDDLVDNNDNDNDPPPKPKPVQGTNTPTVNSNPQPDPQKLFEQRKEELLKEFQMPAGLMGDTGSPSTPVVVITGNEVLGEGPSPSGLTDAEWKEAAECQQGLDALYKNWPLSAADIALADKLEARRNTLWRKAISIPGLTAEERERFRLKLHTLNTQSDKPIPTITDETKKQWAKPPPPLPNSPQAKPTPPAINPIGSLLVGEFALGQAQGAVEFGGEIWADSILEENKYGDFLGISKIAVAYKEGGAASAIAETGNFLVGKIPFPQATIAVEGGRLYSNVVFQAQNKFMTDAMKAAGGEFDKEKFWSDFNEDLNVWQRAVKEFIGYGTE